MGCMIVLSINSIKNTLYNQIFEHKDKNDTYDIILFIIIAFNLLIMSIETMPKLSESIHNILLHIDNAIIILFLIDYILRVWCCNIKIGRLKYITSFNGLVDLLCLIPVGLLPINTQIFRAFRLIRIFRVLKVAKHIKGYKAIENALSKNRQALLSSFVFIFLVVFVLSSVVYYCEHSAQPDKFTSIPHSLWWGVITLTSVGYGDMFPITTMGKLVTCVLSLLAIPLTAIPGGIIFSGIVEELKKD